MSNFEISERIHYNRYSTVCTISNQNMQKAANHIKEKMLEFTRLFSIEQNIFQRFVIVYRYIYFLNTDPVAKSILQRIFDQTTEYLGNVPPDEAFLDVNGDAIFSREFWLYYSNLKTIHERMKQMKECKMSDKSSLNSLYRLFSKPYSREMLELSFKVVNSEVFDRLDQECFVANESDTDEKTYFDKKKSILHIKGKVVRINKSSQITNAHKILQYIFITNKNNLDDEFFYSEIAMDEFDEIDYSGRKNNWRRYHRACTDINDKITDQTNNIITDFLVYNTGRRGSVQVNQKYL